MAYQKYFGGFKHRDDIPYQECPSDREVVYAGYDYDPYEGHALVVFVKDGAWYENNDSHCSCHGLEDWRPELTTPDALLMRPERGGAVWPGLHDAVRGYIAGELGEVG